jgi:hypothetical protein
MQQSKSSTLIVIPCSCEELVWGDTLREANDNFSFHRSAAGLHLAKRPIAIAQPITPEVIRQIKAEQRGLKMVEDRKKRVGFAMRPIDNEDEIEDGDGLGAMRGLFNALLIVGGVAICFFIGWAMLHWGH